MQEQFIVNLMQTNTSYYNVICLLQSFEILHVPCGISVHQYTLIHNTNMKKFALK